MKTCKHLIFVTFLLFIVCQVHSQSNNNSTGCISGDCENGQGTYIFDDGIKYEGDFKNGNLTGKGTIYWPNGNTYTGELLPMLLIALFERREMIHLFSCTTRI